MDAIHAEGASRLPRGPLSLEDLSVGDTFVTSATEITEADVLAFAEKYDPQPFHLDVRRAEESFFGGLVASGWHTAAVTMSLAVREGFVFADGMIGLNGRIEWPTPTRPGDVLHVAGTVVSIRRSASRPTRGFVEVRWQTVASDQSVRQTFVGTILVFARVPVGGEE